MLETGRSMMVTCEQCGKQLKTPQALKGHRQFKHGGPDGAPSEGSQGEHYPSGPARDKRRSHALSPVNAALVEFASQTFVVPNTPALTYGYLCARKHGFDGDMALFLQEVIDDFYHSRSVNYYQEVMGWEGIEEIISELG